MHLFHADAADGACEAAPTTTPGARTAPTADPLLAALESGITRALRSNRPLIVSRLPVATPLSPQKQQQQQQGQVQQQAQSQGMGTGKVQQQVQSHGMGAAAASAAASVGGAGVQGAGQEQAQQGQPQQPPQPQQQRGGAAGDASVQAIHPAQDPEVRCLLCVWVGEGGGL